MIYFYIALSIFVLGIVFAIIVPYEYDLLHVVSTHLKIPHDFLANSEMSVLILFSLLSCLKNNRILIRGLSIFFILWGLWVMYTSYVGS